MATVVDYAGGVPRASAIRSSGHVGAVRYIAPDRTGGSLPGKPIKKNEVADFRANGLNLAFVWQYGKERDADVLRGYNGGVADARSAQSKLNELGFPDHPVFFAVDYDMPRSEWDRVGASYFRGAISVLGPERVGIYGKAEVCRWAAFSSGVVPQVAPNRYLAWVTKGWSRGDTGRDFAVLYQRVVDTASNPGPRVGGVVVDVNDVYHHEWGQKPRKNKEGGVVSKAPKRYPGWSGDPTWLPSALRAFGVNVVEDPGWDQWGNGDFKTVWGAVAHHTGADNTTKNVIRYGHSALRGLLSQVHLAKDGTATLVGVGVAWHAGKGSWPGLPTDNANYHTIGIEAVSNGSSPWPKEQLDAYYRICAAICWTLGHNADRVIAHHEWGSIQRKWDLGENGKPMDMTKFRRNVQKYIDNPPFKESITMTDFDKIDRKYTTRADDSGFKGRPLDYLLNADAHAFHARVNSLAAVDELRLHSEELAEQTKILRRIEAKLNGA